MYANPRKRDQLPHDENQQFSHPQHSPYLPAHITTTTLFSLVAAPHCKHPLQGCLEPSVHLLQEAGVIQIDRPREDLCWLWLWLDRRQRRRVWRVQAIQAGSMIFLTFPSTPSSLVALPSHVAVEPRVDPRGAWSTRTPNRLALAPRHDHDGMSRAMREILLTPQRAVGPGRQ